MRGLRSRAKLVQNMRMLAAALLLSVAAQASRAADNSWLRMRSAHFELFTDAGAGTGREILRRMEQIRYVFELRTGRRNLTPLPVRLFAFRSEADFRPYQVIKEAAGYYQAGTERDYIAMQVSGTDLYRIVFHEYVHLLMRHAGVVVPVWFNEGTAEVYSTTQLSSREIRIGELIPVHLATLRAERLLDLPTLLSVDHQSAHYNERDKTGIFYAESWALVHMLNFSPVYQPGMPNFISMLLDGEDPLRAIQQAFGKSSAAVLSDLAAYIRRDRFAAVRFPADRPHGLGRIVPEPVPEVESGLALSDLLLALGRTDSAEAMLQQIAVAHPDNPGVEAALGDAALQRKLDAKACAHFRRAIQLGSRSGRVRYDYAMALRELRFPDEEIMSALEESVRLEPRLFDAHYLLGYMLLRNGRYREAVEQLKAASDGAPNRSAVWEHLALAYHYSGQREEARAAVQKARRSAATPEEMERAEATAKLIESNAESIVRSEPSGLRARAAQAAEAAATVRTEGLLTQIDCLGKKARLHVSTDSGRLYLLVRDPGSVILRNAGAVWAEFSCGSVPPRPVIVEYRRKSNATYRTSGEVAVIEFR